ncbi:MAG TPA: hypothetical protein VNF71_08100 [Acidimicrobiales bacterium]|nr:hypothetical protein [Acidimicrobiales bacterium]
MPLAPARSYLSRTAEISAPTDRQSLRWHGWRFAAVVYVLVVGLCSFATFALPDLLGYHQWLALGDGKWTIESAQWVSWGGIGSVYSANPQFLPLPGFLIILAPAVALGNHLGLVTGYPYALRYPSMLLVAGPVFFLTGSTAILGVDYLADTLQTSRFRRRVIVASTGLLVVIPTTVWAGHPEDLAGIALACASLAALLRRRYLGAALLLAFAVMMQTWAGLLIPILIAATPAGKRVRALIWSSLLPGLTAALLLVLDFHDAFRSLIVQPMQGNGQHLPWWGLAHKLTIMQSGVPVVVRVGSASRSLAVVAAFVAAIIVWRKPTAQTILAAAATVLLARGASETQFWSYYLAPAAVLMAVASATSGVERRRWTLGGGSALVAYCCAAGGYDAYSLPGATTVLMPPFLALGVLIACGAGVVIATRSRTPASDPRLLSQSQLAPDDFNGPTSCPEAALEPSLL